MTREMLSSGPRAGFYVPARSFYREHTQGEVAPKVLAALTTGTLGALLANPAYGKWVEGIDIAGPGFINLRLTHAARIAVLETISAQGERFGRAARTEQKVLVEFVSANPTGPLHVGHARQAALGDALCRLFDASGFAVSREFYYNDAGNQIHNRNFDLLLLFLVYNRNP
jgi:arginyl-tRNA synthetase